MARKTKLKHQKPFLVLDDNVDITSALQFIIEDNGDSVECYQNPQEALGVFYDNQGKYKGIFTDLQMPIMNGEEFIEKVREKDQTLPIVIVTGNADSLTENFQEDKEIQQVIEKPFEIEEIVNALQFIEDIN